MLTISKFDLCDPKGHFALVVPQRARSCPPGPPLLNAIFTASVRHLSRLNKYKTPQGVKYLDKLLPDLNVETAIHYHERTTTHLIQLCKNPDQVHDENLLAAASILRFYEGVDGMFSLCINWSYINNKSDRKSPSPRSLRCR
jgi:hypothetical protein